MFYSQVKKMSIESLAQTLQCNKWVMLENAKPIRHHGDITAKNTFTMYNEPV